MTSRAASTVALLVVPPGTHRPEPLASAIHELHPDWEIRPVWAGDPHLRPVLRAPLEQWFDPSGEVSLVRQRQLVACSSEHAWWLRALTAARTCLDRSDVATLVLFRVGAVAVLDRLDSLVEPLTGERVAVAVPRAAGPLDDDRVPNEAELLEGGSWSTSVLAFSSGADPMLRWMERQIMCSAIDCPVGRVLDRAIAAFGVASCSDPAVGAGAVRWDVDRPVLLDLPGFDANEPWVLERRDGRRARVDVAADPERRRAIAAAHGQLAGRVEPVSVPGGLVVDDIVVAAARRALAANVDVSPAFQAPRAFLREIGEFYWTEVHSRRNDLVVHFPDPNGVHRDAFRRWSRHAVADDDVALCMPPLDERVARGTWSVGEDLLPSGVNVVGYFRRQLSLGDVARQISSALASAGQRFVALAHERTQSPPVDPGIDLSNEICFDRSLAVVNADQFPGLAMDHPELFATGTHLVGYWFWELEHVPRPMREAARMVDEIWVGSKFVADAFRAAVDTPVRHVPIPIGEPVASARTRATFPRLSELGDRFVFSVVFDHFSVTERKNPVGVIEAFCRAFAPGEGPVLVVKSMNADRRWPQHQHVVWAAGDRPDIVLWDEHLGRADHMAFIRSVDALVSLHRSEGLGLHLAEAMWLGTPVIASRYSGNLDFMDDECSLLIDVDLVPVVRGEGVYPPEARWADPDLDQAASAMRRLFEDPSLAERLSTAARRRMEQQPSLADTGRTIAALLGLPVGGGGGMAS